MKKRLNPTEILLKELPPEGREYDYSNESAELTESLKDIIGTNSYEVRLTIRPTGNVFDVQGEVKTGLNLACSLCAIDFQFPVEQKFHEVLVIQEPLHKGDQNTKTNNASEWNWERPEGVYLETATFDVAQFVRELVGIAEPIRPLGKPNCDENCENIKERPQRDWLSIGAKDSISVKNSPFVALEKMKLKS